MAARSSLGLPELKPEYIMRGAFGNARASTPSVRPAGSAEYQAAMMSACAGHDSSCQPAPLSGQCPTGTPTELSNAQRNV
eukprot:7389288-Prymnesium_polylepis.1